MRKLRNSFLTLVGIAFLFGANGANAALSAHRPLTMPAALYLRSAQNFWISSGHYSAKGPVVWEKGLAAAASWDRVPAIKDADLQTSFDFVRDELAFGDAVKEHPVRRRATWLFPDDGCFVRAVIAADVIEKKLAVNSAKIFAFGDLSVKTKNSPDGAVGWWYHVAAITKVSDAAGRKGDVFYVYDPAIDAKKPIEVKAWLKAMNAPDAEIAICSGDAYDPDSDCAAGQADTYGRAQKEGQGFMQMEWHRLEQMGRNPKRELGDFPPWL